MERMEQVMDKERAFKVQSSLKDMANAYGLEPEGLHNGANDAAFTLQVLLAQCGVEAVRPERIRSNHLGTTRFKEAQAKAGCQKLTPSEETLQQLKLEALHFRQSLEQDTAE